MCRHLLNWPRQKNIQDTEIKSRKLLLLDHRLTPQGKRGTTQLLTVLPDLERGPPGHCCTADLASRTVQRGGQTQSLAEVVALEGLELRDVAVEVDYSYWGVTHVLQAGRACRSRGTGSCRACLPAASLLGCLVTCAGCSCTWKWCAAVREPAARSVLLCSGCCQLAWRCRAPLKPWAMWPT